MNVIGRKSNSGDNYADWVMLFEELATSDRGFDESVELDQDVIDELYDEDLSVQQALVKYHELV